MTPLHINVASMTQRIRLIYVNTTFLATHNAPTTPATPTVKINGIILMQKLMQCIITEENPIKYHHWSLVFNKYSWKQVYSSVGGQIVFKQMSCFISIRVSFQQPQEPTILPLFQPNSASF